jgi:hypothetical protein
MKTIYLRRVSYTDTGTWGVLLDSNRIPLMNTFELPWKENRTGESCIPERSYLVKPFNSPKFGKCLKIENVPGRSGILIHSGNTAGDTRGCVLVGHTWGADGVYQSRDALARLIGMIEPMGVQIIISS